MKSFENGDKKLRYWGLGFVASLTNIDIGAFSMLRDIAIQPLFSDSELILILSALI
ncbi:hypothetical protein ACWKTL_27380 [Bacillus toyonensis]|uniref:hypothetical protein n=1 Tax=Bacillus toyonensis TaxID=155322 RepID=UPI0015C4FB6A|nr:hypothetical protein [Bacillus toyonensis]MED3201320.1 hypothetical protein [Bacillus toyonensis]